MTVSFTLISYSSIDSLADLSCPMFTIDPGELDYGTTGIARALDECIDAGMIAGWPNDLHPRSYKDGCFELETQYKELYEECKAVLDWHTECNPEGDLSEACFWVRVNFE